MGVKVDGVDVDKANYEATSGSTIITLRASYLETLAVGEHTITVNYIDGSTNGTFKIEAKSSDLVTGDNNNIWLWFTIASISGGVAITLTVVSRKKKMI